MDRPTGLRETLIILALLWVTATGCGPIKPPQPTPNPNRNVIIVVPTPDGTSRVANAVIYIDNTGGGQQCKTQADGICTFSLPMSLRETYVTVSAPGFSLYRQDAVGLPATDVQVWTGPGCIVSQCVNLPALTPLLVDLPHLVVNGRVFALSTGQPFIGKEADGYTWYQMWLEGNQADVKRFAHQRSSAGFNMVRVFGMYDNSAGIGHFRPEQYGSAYWTERKSFADALAAEGLYLQWTQFADASQFDCGILTSLAQNSVHAFDGITNSLFEWINEADQPMNKFPAGCNPAMPRIHGVLTSAGSNGSQAWPVQPYLDFVTFHTNDAVEEERKISHNCYEIQPSLPCLTNETSRVDHHNWQIAPMVFANDAFAACTLLNAGCDFHTALDGGLWSDLVLGIAKAVIAGFNSVPMSCQNLPYVHRQDMEPPPILRTYQGGTRQDCIVMIRKSTGE